jgi:predicted CopG family antitoxin
MFSIYEVDVMKTISLHVPEDAYSELKSLAARRDQSVAAVIREAMDNYLEQERKRGRSVLDLEPFRCGRLRKRWTKSDVLDEMLNR